ncbi:GyrI-like domain-containing protein [Amphibacillus sp. Q70]|uniref:GyrI-like domain-containing protein n=1 Tax=Amphibacillus sp. Q70 TaxID=3453416 RepID=UPI003F86BF6B
MKHEWRKHEKERYGAKKIPALVNVPLQKFIMISGKGNPNKADFSDKVSALYSLAYAIKMGYKSASADNKLLSDIQDFTVYPLEGIWQQKEDTELIKENLEYTLMIRQPDCITEEMVCEALERVKIKKPSPLYEDIHFDTIQDGKCVEILHVGSFDEEAVSFEKMDEFTRKNKLKRTENYHREIYLTNANRVDKSKLKTILRYSVKE